MQEGDIFYLLSTDATESVHLFRDPNTQFVGGFVAIYEGTRDKSIHGIPVVTTVTSLVPIVPDLVNIKLNSSVRDLALTEEIQGFLVEIQAPMFGQCGRVVSCRSPFCDTRHSARVACPSLAAGKTTGHAITFRLSSPAHRIVNCDYTGEALAKIFIAPRVLAVRLITYDTLQIQLAENN